MWTYVKVRQQNESSRSSFKLIHLREQENKFRISGVETPHIIN